MILKSYGAMQSNVLWLTFKFFHAAKEKMIRNYSFIINFHNVDIYTFLSKLRSKSNEKEPLIRIVYNTKIKSYPKMFSMVSVVFTNPPKLQIQSINTVICTLLACEIGFPRKIDLIYNVDMTARGSLFLLPDYCLNYSHDIDMRYKV